MTKRKRRFAGYGGARGSKTTGQGRESEFYVRQWSLCSVSQVRGRWGFVYSGSGADSRTSSRAG